MTAPTISATPKKALDQRATSRHDNALAAIPRPMAHANPDFSGRARMSCDKGGPNGIPKPAGAGGGSSSLSLEPSEPESRNLEITLRLRPEGDSRLQWRFGQCRLVEQNKRLQDRVNFNDGATIELAQRGSVLDGPGIRNPGREDCPLFRRGQLWIARDVTRMSIDRRRP